MVKLTGIIFAALLLALVSLLYAYGFDAPFWKTYSVVGAIWITIYFLIPARYRT